MSKSRIEVYAADNAGRLFVGTAELVWAATAKDDGAEFVPSVVHEWQIHNSNGRSIGWLPLPVKP